MLLSTQTDYMSRTFGPTEGVRKLCQAGYDALDLSLFSMNNEDAVENGPDYRSYAAELKAAAAEYNVPFRQAHAPFGGGYDFYTGTLLPRMPRAFEIAALCGVKTIIVHPLTQGRYYGRAEELFRMNMEFYRRLLPVAKEYDLVIGVENMWEWDERREVICDSVCAPPEELCRYVDTLNDPHFTVCLDIGHVGLCGREPQDAIRAIGHDRLGALHVHDVDYRHDLHTLPYCGQYDWEPICRALHDVQYRGDLTFEADNFFEHFPVEMAEEAARFMVKVGRNLIARIEKD